MALFGGPSTPVSRLEELKRLLQKDPTSRQFLALAEEYRRHGKYRDAVITLERGLQMHSTSVAAHVALGKTYQQLDRLEDAIRAFTNALRIDRENLVAIRQLAEVYLARGDKIEAIKKLKLYRGLKAGDRDVNDIIQRLEEEMSAAVAERPRSGVQPGFSELPEIPRPSPDFASGVRRAAMIPAAGPRRRRRPRRPFPRTRRSRTSWQLTYDGAARLARRSRRRARAAVSRPARAVPRAAAGRRPLRGSVSRGGPSPCRSAAGSASAAEFELPPFTAPIATIREEPVAEIAPFALGEAGAGAGRSGGRGDRPVHVPGGPLPDGGPCAASRARGTPVEPPRSTSPDARSRRAPAALPRLPHRQCRSSRRRSGTSTARRATWPTHARPTARSRKPPPTRHARAPCARRPPRSRAAERTRPSAPPAARAALPEAHGSRPWTTCTGSSRDLVEGTEGIRAATLTDLEGLPVVMAGTVVARRRDGDPRRGAQLLPEERPAHDGRDRRGRARVASRSPARTAGPSSRA